MDKLTYGQSYTILDAQSKIDWIEDSIKQLIISTESQSKTKNWNSDHLNLNN